MLCEHRSLCVHSQIDHYRFHWIFRLCHILVCVNDAVDQSDPEFLVEASPISAHPALGKQPARLLALALRERSGDLGIPVIHIRGAVLEHQVIKSGLSGDRRDFAFL